MKQKVLFALVLMVGFFLVTACVKTKVTQKSETPTVTETPKEETKWTESKDPGDMSTDEIKGKINEKEGSILNVSVKKWEDDYSWTFSNKAQETACSVNIDDDGVNFSAKDLREGTFTKAMEEEVDFNDYHAYYYYEMEDGNPMSVNVSWSAKIVVEKIDEEAKKVDGYARFEFEDGKTKIEGKYTADLCE